jgi:hypothetical protein
MLGPLIVYTDLNDLRLLATFGAWEMMARLTARRSLVSPMIKKDFLARFRFQLTVSANLWR